MERIAEDKIATIFAWRFTEKDYSRGQWYIDAVFMPYPELCVLWKKIHGPHVDMRKIEVDFSAEEAKTATGARLNTPELLSQYSPKYKGWWQDPFTKRWIAPGEFIKSPGRTLNRQNDVACSFIPQGHGWINFVLATEKRVAMLNFSNVFDPTGDLLLWLEKIYKGDFPRFELDEEGVDVELHCLPIESYRVSSDIVKLSAAEQTLWIELIIVRCGVNTELLLQIAIPRRALIHSIYNAFLNAQIVHPEHMLNWPYDPHKWAKARDEGLIVNKEGPVFCRSPFLDEALKLGSKSV